MNGTKTNDNFFQTKKNLKWFRSRIEDFNNTVPTLIATLITHKNNIKKQRRLENHAAVKQEKTAAERVIRNLRQLLIDIDGLRKQIKDCDLERFDKLVSASRESITVTINNFNDFYKSISGHDRRASPQINAAIDDYSGASSDSDLGRDQLLLNARSDVYDLQFALEREKAIQQIERDTQCVNEIFHDLAQLVEVQKDRVENIEQHVENSHEQVVAAEKQLAQVAAKVSGAMYPIVGAIVGSCIGGPIGFLAGLKVGTLAAVSCSLIGLSGGTVLKSKQRKLQREILEGVKEQPTIKS